MAIPNTDNEDLSTSIVAKYDAQKKRGNKKTPFDCTDIVEEITELVASRSRVVLIVDGLDECDAGARKGLLDVLCELLDKVSYLWILVSSRPYGDISNLLPPAYVEVAVEADRSAEDVRKFIDKELASARTSTRPPPAGPVLKKDSELCERIAKETFEKGQSM